MAGAKQQHTQTGLPDTAADGLGQLAAQQHLVEGQASPLIVAGEGQLLVQRRLIHPDAHVPIPRLGGLAIFLGFIVSILLFVEMTDQFRSILLGAVIIVVLGVVDDITPLPAKFKFLIQIAAALIPALNGVVIHVLSNPNLLSENPYWDMPPNRR